MIVLRKDGHWNVVYMYNTFFGNGDGQGIYFGDLNGNSTVGDSVFSQGNGCNFGYINGNGESRLTITTLVWFRCDR